MSPRCPGAAGGYGASLHALFAVSAGCAFSPAVNQAHSEEGRQQFYRLQPGDVQASFAAVVSVEDDFDASHEGNEARLGRLERFLSESTASRASAFTAILYHALQVGASSSWGSSIGESSNRTMPTTSGNTAGPSTTGATTTHRGSTTVEDTAVNTDTTTGEAGGTETTSKLDAREQEMVKAEAAKEVARILNEDAANVSAAQGDSAGSAQKEASVQVAALLRKEAAKQAKESARRSAVLAAKKKQEKQAAEKKKKETAYQQSAANTVLKDAARMLRIIQ
eukprot:TRINITY_DN11446_c0_g1_i1.p1 TRINITY_DN11446_c0_g1~~TRINITY_DN11446_c0_g1_i1.p1  ORF type:complete len:280 (-),score=58.86 TRINITY_DN11446_c0_g1_i1:91-930(-)